MSISLRAQSTTADALSSSWTVCAKKSQSAIPRLTRRKYSSTPFIRTARRPSHSGTRKKELSASQRRHGTNSEMRRSRLKNMPILQFPSSRTASSAHGKTGNPEESREHSAMRASDTAAAPFTPTEKRKCTETRRAPISSAWKRAKTRGSKCFSRSTNRESAPA